MVPKPAQNLPAQKEQARELELEQEQEQEKERERERKSRCASGRTCTRLFS